MTKAHFVLLLNSNTNELPSRGVRSKIGTEYGRTGVLTSLKNVDWLVFRTLAISNGSVEKSYWFPLDWSLNVPHIQFHIILYLRTRCLQLLDSELQARFVWVSRSSARQLKCNKQLSSLSIVSLIAVSYLHWKLCGPGIVSVCGETTAWIPEFVTENNYNRLNSCNVALTCIIVCTDCSQITWKNRLQVFCFQGCAIGDYIRTFLHTQLLLLHLLRIWCFLFSFGLIIGSKNYFGLSSPHSSSQVNLRVWWIRWIKLGSILQLIACVWSFHEVIWRLKAFNRFKLLL